MGIGVGIFLIAVGAILTFAVDATRRAPRTVMTEGRRHDDTSQPLA